MVLFQIYQGSAPSMSLTDNLTTYYKPNISRVIKDCARDIALGGLPLDFYDDSRIDYMPDKYLSSLSNKFPIEQHGSTSYGNTTSFSYEKWEGYVTKVGEDDFHATVVDLKNNNPDEEVTIPFDQINKTDQHLIVEGAVFYWNIGYETRGGQRRNISEIRFRRMPKISAREVKLSYNRAKLIRNSLNIIK